MKKSTGFIVLLAALVGLGGAATGTSAATETEPVQPQLRWAPRIVEVELEQGESYDISTFIRHKFGDSGSFTTYVIQVDTVDPKGEMFELNLLRYKNKNNVIEEDGIYSSDFYGGKTSGLKYANSYDTSNSDPIIGMAKVGRLTSYSAGRAKYKIFLNQKIVHYFDPKNPNLSDIKPTN